MPFKWCKGANRVLSSPLIGLNSKSKNENEKLEAPWDNLENPVCGFKATNSKTFWNIESSKNQFQFQIQMENIKNSWMAVFDGLSLSWQVFEGHKGRAKNMGNLIQLWNVGSYIFCQVNMSFSTLALFD